MQDPLSASVDADDARACPTFTVTFKVSSPRAHRTRRDHPRPCGRRQGDPENEGNPPVKHRRLDVRFSVNLATPFPSLASLISDPARGAGKCRTSALERWRRSPVRFWDACPLLWLLIPL